MIALGSDAAMPLIDGDTVAGGETIEAAVGVVGAGAAGITLARELSAAGVDTLLLEGGGLQPSAGSQSLYEADSVGRYPINPTACRQRYLGGSTNCWDGYCRPLEPEDFAAAPDLGRAGWPLTAAELAPFYERAARSVGIAGGDFDAVSVAERSQRQLLPLDARRVVQPLYQFSDARFGEWYRPELEQPAGPRVYYNASLTGLRLGPDGRRVRQLRCRTPGGRELAVTVGDCVLALGGIENARLLLAASGSSVPGIGNRGGWVGMGFMEHPHLYGAGVLALKATQDTSAYTRRWTGAPREDQGHSQTPLLAALALSGQVRQTEGLVNLAVTLHRLQDDQAAEARGAAAAGAIAALLPDAPELRFYSLTVRAEQRATRSSRIELGQERDALGLPRARIRWEIENKDLVQIRRSLDLLGTEFARAGLGRLWRSPDPEESWTVREGCHHMGTTRMAEDAGGGVVDRNARVFGVENLFVAGASVFASAGHANPTLTLLALAHRLADHLIERNEAP